VRVVRHEARETSPYGVQNCRRCGSVLCDLAFSGHIEFKLGEVFEVDAALFCQPDVVSDIQREAAIDCPWRVN